MIEINVNHPIKLTRLAMRALAGANKKGVVCLVASTAGIRANYLASLYTASKHAVVGFAKAMGQADPEEGVKVVAICPGMVASPLWTDRQDDRAKASRYRERPAMQPFDITKVVLKVVESQEYGGGTVVLKTIEMEKVVEVGYDKREKANDPSPRPDADLSHIKRVLDGERGVEWDPVYDKEA
jgi:short-subunit dehydrogenase